MASHFARKTGAESIRVPDPAELVEERAEYRENHGKRENCIDRACPARTALVLTNTFSVTGADILVNKVTSVAGTTKPLYHCYDCDQPFVTKKAVMRCQDKHHLTRGKTSVFPIHYVKAGEILVYYGYQGIPIRAPASPIPVTPVIPGHQAEAAAAEAAAEANENAARVAEAANNAARVAEQAAEIARLRAAVQQTDNTMAAMAATARDNSYSFRVALDIANRNRAPSRPQQVPPPQRQMPPPVHNNGAVYRGHHAVNANSTRSRTAPRH